eukprot:21169_1
MDANCSTTSLIPTWVTICFFGSTLFILLFTAIYSVKVLKNDQKWTDADCCKKFIMSIKDVFSRKSIYLPIVSHLADTSTDFATVVEFGIIAFTQNCDAINVGYLFGLSIAIMLLYRSLSSWVIYNITGSLSRIVLQFMDIELFRILYVSHKMGLNAKSSPHRLISVLEAVFEAAPQGVIQIIFLVNTKSLSTVVMISSILSFINLTATIISDDKVFLDIKWKTTIGDHDNQYQSILPFIYLYTFRVLDVPSKILSYVFMWYFAGGIACTCYVAVECLISVGVYVICRQTDALLGIIATPFSLGDDESWFPAGLILYLVCSTCTSLSINIIIIIFAIANDVYDDAPFIFGLFVYFATASFLKYYFLLKLFKVHANNFVFNSKSRAQIGKLLRPMKNNNGFQDALEILVYSDKLVQDYKNKKIYYGKEMMDPDYTVLELVLDANNEKILTLLLEDCTDNDKDFTILMTLAMRGNDNLLKPLLLFKWVTLDYVKQKSADDGLTAFHYIIQSSPCLISPFWECILQIFSETERKEILNQTEHTWKTETMLQWTMIQSETTIEIFKEVYNLYPSSADKTKLLNDCLVYKSIEKEDWKMSLEIQEFIEVEITNLSKLQQTKNDQDGVKDEEKTNKDKALKEEQTKTTLDIELQIKTNTEMVQKQIL